MSTTEKSYYGHRQRLRKKFTQSGLSGFHDYEALELLLTFAIPRRDVKPCAKTLLKKFKGINGVLEAPVEKLRLVPGLGEQASLFLRLTKELTRALLAEALIPEKALNAPEDVASYVTERIGTENGEALYALYLNSKNRAIGLVPICDGPPNTVNLSPRLVLEKAIESNARSIIFIHKALSLIAAEESPSRPIALALKDSASTIDVVVHDYIILAGGSVLSARNEGWFEG